MSDNEIEKKKKIVVKNRNQRIMIIFDIKTISIVLF